MGTFARIIGTLTVPEDKKEELREREYELFCRGGMCAFEEVALFGDKLYLLTPPETDESGNFQVWHSYFEDASWEPSGYNAIGRFVWSGKLGWRDYNQILFAAYLLEEQYSVTPCYAEIDGRKQAVEHYCGWLNNLFDETYSLQGRNFWDLYLAKRQDNLIKNQLNDEITFSILADESVGADTDSLIAMLCAEYEESILDCKKDERDPDHEFGQNIYDLYHCLMGIRGSIDSNEDIESGGTREHYERQQVQDLVAILCGEMELSRPGTSEDTGKWAEFALLAKKVIPQIAIRLICDVYGMNFWEVWDLVGDRTTICVPLKKTEQAIKSLPIQDLLFHETRYYLYFWREGNGISLSGLDKWFAGLKERYDRLIACGGEIAEGISEIQMMRSMIDILDKANEHYGCIFAFREMFYDFIENCSDRRYRAWWKIFCDLVEENWDEDKVNEEKTRLGESYILFDPKYLSVKEKPARAEIKGYLGLMANKALRTKMFGA